MQLADTLVKLVAPNLPNPQSAYAGKIRSEIEAAVPKGYDAVMKALQPHMTGGYGQYVTRAVNSALANPAVSELKAAVDEAAGSFQSMSPQGAAPAMPAAGTSAQTGATQLARGGTRSVQRWQQNYNRVNKLKPGTPGYLKPDGLWGPATQAAYQKMQAAKPAASETAAPPNRELPPMPGQAPTGQAPQAQKGDLWAPVKQQAQLNLFPYVMQLMGARSARELPVSAISQLKQLIKQEVDRAVADIGGTQFKDNKSRDEYIRNLALQNLRSSLTPEVVNSLRAG